MAYQDTAYKQRGVQREPIVMEGVIHSLRKNGFPEAKAQETTLSENMNDKIDYRIIPGKHETFKGHVIVPVDIKTGWSYTLVTTTGVNTLKKSKAAYLIYEFEKTDEYYAFIRVSKLRELVDRIPPKLKHSRFNSSVYFSMVDYIYENTNEFEEGIDYFEIPK